MDRRFASILAVLFVVIIGLVVINKNSSNSGDGSKGGQSQVTNHTYGDNKKGVTLVEYGDYECPVCEVYYQPLKQAAEQYKSDIHFQFRNLPLSSIHRNAFAAARAAEAAGMQNKYWEMHDLLYENQSDWAESTAPQTIFNGYAKQLGLNTDKFKQDYSSQQVNNAINADLAAFLNTPYANHETNKEATPTFFLNGRYVSNSNFADPKTGQPSLERISAVIKAEIDKKNSTSKQ